MTPSNILDITQSGANAPSKVSILNSNTGGAAEAGFVASNGTSSGILSHLGTSFSTSGVYRQNGTYIAASGVGGLTLVTSAAQPIYFGINNAEVARFDTGGELLIGTTTDNGAYLLQVNSQIFATNATVATSDARLKRELPALTPDVVEKVMAIPTRFYERTDRPRDGSRAGYFAQDWEAIFGLDTGIVKRPPSGTLQLDEGAAHSLKIMAVEQALATLTERVNRLT